ncbi:MAG TPA: hypothetical protein DEP72_08605 [Clostridiales bacterium]|nr:MAG: hypothetical protein A2Y18_07215 [Clostridiales bacterium GWD2_32_19]HCC08198.1 hypothetical protein [Clostridiales bacterium]
MLIVVASTVKLTTSDKVDVSQTKNVKQERKTIEKSKTKKSQMKDDEMILYRFDDKELQIYSLLPDDNLLMMKFQKKAWGTWDIGGWYISNDGKIPSKKYTLMAGGRSDWEYALRVRTNPKEKYFFTGGSHGKEFIKSFKFFNADDGTALPIKNGEKKTVKRFKILEETILSTTNENNTPYANVSREYIISPSKISLDTDFKFTKDIYMGTSYVSMLPISKEYGRYAWFVGTPNLATTPKYGKTLADENINNYYGEVKALSVIMWGDKKPEYIFKASISDSNMVDNFQNSLKTFYWDINKMANKLYFSKYENYEDTKVKKGTEWNNNSEWSITVLPKKYR